MVAEYSVELLISLGLPAAGAVTFIIRYFWKKSQCFEIMKTRLERLEAEQTRDRNTHHDLYEKIDDISNTVHWIKGKIENGKL